MWHSIPALPAHSVQRCGWLLVASFCIRQTLGHYGILGAFCSTILLFILFINLQLLRLLITGETPIYLVTPTASYYWLTNLGRTWNQRSEFSQTQTKQSNISSALIPYNLTVKQDSCNYALSWLNVSENIEIDASLAWWCNISRCSTVTSLIMKGEPRKWNQA